MGHWIREMRRAGLVMCSALWLGVALAAPINLPVTGGPTLTAHWLPAADEGRRPAIIALHGCGGLYRRDGKTLDTRYTEYAELFHRAGWHVLLPDSFTARGQRSICATASTDREIRVETRRADVLAALVWLSARTDVDATRIAIVGWSHGAMTTLNTINAARTEYARPLAGAAVFYPGCSALLNWPFKVDVPVLMMLGEKDDWTPPARCVALAEQARQRNPDVAFTVLTYPDSYHGFDSAQPVRFRSDVPHGVDKKGVHAGGNPAARDSARTELMKFLTRVLQ